jgi:protein SMG6
MTALHPFPTARESVLPLWSSPAQARRFPPDARVSHLFVLLHGMLFTNIQLDDFQPILARFIERLELDGAQEREWIMMAVVNIGAVLEYGRPGGILRHASGVATRESDAASAQGQNAIKVVTKKAVGITHPDISGSLDKMDIDDEQAQGDSESKQISGTHAGDCPQELPAHFVLALQLTFSMLTHVLRSPHLKSSAYAHPDVNPYLTVILTFLVTMFKYPIALQILERSLPWEELAIFFSKVPRAYMIKQGLLNHTSQFQSSSSTAADRGKWSMLTNGCAPPLPEDWCMRGMEWVGRRVFERGYWKTDSMRDECKTELDALGKTDHVDVTDGTIEDDDGVDANQTSADASIRSTPKISISQVERRWVRILRCAVGIADVVDGFTWQTGTKVWAVEGRLMEKVRLWKEQDQVAKEEEKRRIGRRWADDSMEVDEEDIVESEESEDETDSEEVRELKVCLCHLILIVH